MRSILLILSIILVALHCEAQYNYPVLVEDTIKIEKFGYRIDDPQRWLEDLDSKRTKDWLYQQSEITRKYRNSIFSSYTIVERELAFSYLENRKKNYVNPKIGGYYFSTKTVGFGDNAPSLHFKTKRANGWDLLLSTGQFQRNNNDVIDIRGITVSDNDSLIAVGISHGGSDWTEIKIVEAESKNLLKDKVEWTKSSVAWCKNGFFYQQYEKPTGANEISSLVKNSAIYYHKIGTDKANDIQLTQNNDNRKYFSVIEKGKFLILFEQKDIKGKKFGTLSYVRSDYLGTDTPTTFLILPGISSETVEIIGEHDGHFLASTTYKAPKGKIMLYDYHKVNQGKQLVEMFNQNLLSAHYLNNKLICIYMDRGNNICLAFNNEGKLIKSIELPSACSIEGFDKVYRDSITYYYVSTFTSPQLTLKFNLNTLKSELPEEDAELQVGTNNTTKIVSYRSRDSTEIFMYLISNNNVKADGNNPVLLYAYGGFGIAERPHFDFAYNMLLSKGAIIAIPLIRGGGEFGADWHEAGRKQNKQNSVDDVIFAANWLIENKYTTSQRIALTGGSQGGWLMAEAMVQKPELFKAVVPIAGVYDLLRFHHYSRTGAIGYEEFGNPEDSVEFGYLTKISPYHQIKKGVDYPACMVITGINDDRVVPFHSYKLLAALQQSGNREKPYLLYLEDNAGHNVSDTYEGFQQISLMYTFIMKMLGMKIY